MCFLEGEKNLDTPTIELLSYGKMKDWNLFYFNEGYNPGYDEAPVWKVTFTTTEVGLHGPIVYYIDSDGNVIAGDFRF